MKIAIIMSKKIQEYAGFRYRELFEKEAIPFIEINGYPHELEDKDIKHIDADFFIALGIHSLKDEKKRFCVHPNGNWAGLWPHPKRNSLGGKEKTLCTASGALLNKVYQSLLQNINLPDYKVSIECTHHGPSISKPIVFLEIGTSSEEWENIQANKVIVQSLRSVLKGFEVDRKSVVVFGGDHYMTKVSELMKERRLQVSHMCPSNQIPHLSAEMIELALTKTHEGVEFVLLDLEALGPYHSKIVNVLSNKNVKYKYLHEM